MKIYGFSTQNNGCGKYRIWEPLAAIQRQGLAEVAREPDDPQPISVERVDGIFRKNDVIFCQPFSELWAACMFAAARDEHRKRLVVDLDDNVWAVHPMNVGPVKGQLTVLKSHFDGEFKDFWELEAIEKDKLRDYAARIDGTIVKHDDGRLFFLHNKRPDPKLAVEFLLQSADAVTTTNEVMAEVIRKHTSAPVFVLPNCLDLSKWRTVAPDPKHKWIGWFGSVSHYPDLRPLLPAFDSLMRRYPDLHLQFMGSSFDYLFPVKKDAKLFPVAGYGPTESMFYADYRDTGQRWPGRMKFNPPVPCQEFEPWLCNHWEAQIAIAPIEPNAFNNAKSELKWLEYTAMGIPVVASDFGPYHRAITNGVDGMLVEMPEFWRPVLESLVNDPGKRESLVNAARERLHEHYDIDKKAPSWMEVFECAPCLAV